MARQVLKETFKLTNVKICRLLLKDVCWMISIKTFYFFLCVFQRCQVQPVNVQSLVHLRASGTANYPHQRLFDCLRAISGN